MNCNRGKQHLTSMALILKSSTHSPLLVFILSHPAMRANICQTPMQSRNRVNIAFSCPSSATKKRTFTVAAATITPNSESENAEVQPRFRRIDYPDLVVQQRKWNVQDMTRVALMVAMHLLCLLAPFTFSWAALWVALGLYVVTVPLGITLCYHRCLSHRSFKLPKWLEYFFAYCGVQTFQWDPIDWVSTHRYHHQFVDTERDPHSPLGGFWHSHISWIFDSHNLVQKCGERNNVGDLEEQAFYKFIQRTYLLHPTALGVLLYAIGGTPFVAWGMGVRLIFTLHVTLLVNSVCHLFGKQPWNTGDLSRNNWILGLLAFGEGWHNNHHAFEFSARHGLEWWQVDATWYVIKFLETVGLAKDIKLPTDNQKRKKALGMRSSQ